MDSIEKKRQKEQRVVEEMIRLYCRKNHKEYDKTTGKMCPSCQELSDYARLRSQKCPFMEEKTFCANCKVHCYKPEMKKRMPAKRDEGEDSEGYAVFRTEDASVSSGTCSVAFDMQ